MFHSSQNIVEKTWHESMQSEKVKLILKGKEIVSHFLHFKPRKGRKMRCPIDLIPLVER